MTGSISSSIDVTVKDIIKLIYKKIFVNYGTLVKLLLDNRLKLLILVYK